MKISILKVYVQISAENESEIERDIKILEIQLRPFAYYISEDVIITTLDEIEVQKKLK